MIPDWEVNGVFLAEMLKARHLYLFSQLHAALTSHGVEVRLLANVQDQWARDYCPIQVGPREFVQFRYEPDYLKDYPELRTGRDVANQFRELGECRHSDINLDGGNVVALRSTVILTDKIYKENPNWKRAELRDKLRSLFQTLDLIVVPKEPLCPIGHIDGMVRFIDDKSVLVNDYAAVDPAFGEQLNKVLRRHGLFIEQVPYFHENRTVQGIPSAVGNYTNFLRTAKVLIAPIYGSKHDDAVFKKLESVFPGLPIVPLNCTALAREGGILNCISAGYRLS